MSAPTPSKSPEEPEASYPTISPPPAPSNPGGPSQSDHSEIPTEVSDGGGGAKAEAEGEDGEGDEEEEEAECGFCVFMKSGGCRDPFVAWERCVEEAERTGEDVVDKCFEVTSLLKKCMDAHADYYAPILHAEAIAAATAAAEAEADAKAEPQANTEPELDESASKPKAEVRD